jgi:hypothetical protein
MLLLLNGLRHLALLFSKVAASDDVPVDLHRDFFDDAHIGCECSRGNEKYYRTAKHNLILYSINRKGHFGRVDMAR